MWRDITSKDREAFNKLATHPLQAYEWGEFREKTGIQVIRKGFFAPLDRKSSNGAGKLQEAFQLTLHEVPHTSFTIGYVPKGTLPSKELFTELQKIGKEHKCIFIQLEPNIVSRHSGDDSEQSVEEDSRIKEGKDSGQAPLQSSKYSGGARMTQLGLRPSAYPLFTQYTFQLDLTQSPEDILKNMSQKTRYNIRVAIKHDVKVREEYSPEAFDAYQKLTQETTNRQGFFSHTKRYHQLMWETLQTPKSLKIKTSTEKNKLEAHLFVAYFEKQPLTTWVVFTFHDFLYYPYGASSSEHRETMSSNLMMWDVIMYGKKMGLRTFDMWGSMGENPDTKDPWYGFHRFKQGYGPKLVEFVGSYDLVINPLLYEGYKIANQLRWLLLRLRK